MMLLTIWLRNESQAGTEERDQVSRTSAALIDATPARADRGAGRLTGLSAVLDREAPL